MLRLRLEKGSSEPTERHVLFLPGMKEDEKRSQCSCVTPCWARYLPPDVPLTREAHDLYVLMSLLCLPYLSLTLALVLQTLGQVLSILRLLVLTRYTGIFPA